MGDHKTQKNYLDGQLIVVVARFRALVLAAHAVVAAALVKDCDDRGEVLALGGTIGTNSNNASAEETGDGLRLDAARASENIGGSRKGGRSGSETGSQSSASLQNLAARRLLSHVDVRRTRNAVSAQRKGRARGESEGGASEQSNRCNGLDHFQISCNPVRIRVFICSKKNAVLDFFSYPPLDCGRSPSPSLI
jgi:hypothetical protein